MGNSRRRSRKRKPKAARRGPGGGNHGAAPKPSTPAAASAKTSRHTWVATFGALAAIGGMLLTWYGLSGPEIRAVDNRLEPLRSTPLPHVSGDSLTYRIEGKQRFRNHSIRGGGYVKEVQLIPHWPGMQGRTPLVNVNTEPIGSFDTKVIEFSADVVVKFDPQTGQVETLPLLVHFIDQAGALITTADGKMPFELDFIIADAKNPQGSVIVFPAEEEK